MEIYYKLPSVKIKLLRDRESNAAHMPVNGIFGNMISRNEISEAKQYF